MATGQLNQVVQHLRGMLAMQDAAGIPDADLLKRYVHERDEAAFETLVRRHGPMVLGVCRRLLHNPHDAEDAFQVTFLVLVRKASSLHSPGTIGNWLYGVAHRTALEVRKAAAKRRAKEAMATPRAETPQDNRADLQLVLDQELRRLPDNQRQAQVPGG
jgi:RNA polymerase sigma factor (sigma-70 family)